MNGPACHKHYFTVFLMRIGKAWIGPSLCWPCYFTGFHSTTVMYSQYHYCGTPCENLDLSRGSQERVFYSQTQTQPQSLILVLWVKQKLNFASDEFKQSAKKNYRLLSPPLPSLLPCTKISSWWAVRHNCLPLYWHKNRTTVKHTYFQRWLTSVILRNNACNYHSP